MPGEMPGAYVPSTDPRVREQAELYESSGGTAGTTIRGYPCVLLTTRGRRSGALRRSPLIRVERDGRYVVVASLGGADHHPQWFRNLLDEPAVTLRDGELVFAARARVLREPERAGWWEHAVRTFPDYAGYQLRTGRVIPVVLVEPEGRAR